MDNMEKELRENLKENLSYIKKMIDMIERVGIEKELHDKTLGIIMDALADIGYSSTNAIWSIQRYYGYQARLSEK